MYHCNERKLTPLLCLPDRADKVWTVSLSSRYSCNMEKLWPSFTNSFLCVLTLLRPGACINPCLCHSSSPTSCQVIVLHHRTLPLRSGLSKHSLHNIPPRRTTTPSTLICTSSLFHPPSELCFRSR